MATIRNVISYVDAIKPNAFDEGVKVQWLNEVEGYIQTEVMMLALADVVQYDPEKDMYTELLVKPPHDKLYSLYLCALVDFANGEYDKYNNTMQMYNKFLGEYIKWYTRVFHPADGGCVREGYYLSAYTIAARHGFEGTEEEWIASLQGKPGEPGASGVFVKEDDADSAPENANVEVDLTEDGDEPYIWIPDSLVREGNLVWMLCDGEKVGEPFEIIDGVPGADGKNFTILGYYSTLEELNAAVSDPEPGDAYGIGTAAPYHAYVFDGVTRTWIDNGQLSGVAGADGVGIRSVEQTATSDEDGGENILTVTLTNGVTSQFAVKNGRKGSPGNTPQRGTDYWTAADQKAIVDAVLANFTDASEVAM